MAWRVAWVQIQKADAGDAGKAWHILPVTATSSTRILSNQGFSSVNGIL